jgi:hypothetical protein
LKGFGKKLSDREMWHVINFILTLAHHHWGFSILDS